ncbi:MAG: hypothetical protein RL670_575 [Actinomycetota bacterium]
MRKAISRFIAPAFYLAVAVFAFFYLRSIDWATLAEVRINWWWMLAATAASLLVRFWFAEIWLLLLRRLGAKVSQQRVALFMVYSKAWLGRYIPGGAAWILGKIYFATKLGISKTKLAVSSFLEGALQIIVVLVTASAMLAFDPHVQAFGKSWVVALLAAALIGLISVYPPVFNRVVNFGYRRLGRGELHAENLTSGATVGAGIAAFALSSVLSGLSFFFVALAVDPNLNAGDLLFIVGCSNLASALSMLAVFAPAGLGVREAVQLSMLLLVMPAETALVATVLMRLWSILMDAAFFGATVLVARLARVNP